MSEANQLTIVQEINSELVKQTKDPATMRALMAVTFKGFKSEQLVKQACLEAMLNGYTFQDLIQKKVYAIPFGDGYSLVQSIEDVRTTAMQSGQCGKSAPEFEEKDGKIISCTVTVKRKVGETIGDYTAKVYFDEYNKGRDNWKTKPRTMIAKVAEMHALRMAFPEKLSKAYIEDEFREESTMTNRYKEIEEDSKSLQMGSILETHNEKTNQNQEGEEQVIDAESNEVIPLWSEKAQ